MIEKCEVMFPTFTEDPAFEVDKNHFKIHRGHNNRVGQFAIVNDILYWVS